MMLLNGCTLIGGLAIGNGLDKHHKSNYIIEANQIYKISKGRKIDINCNDGKVVTGIYKGRTQLTQERYAENYLKFKNRYSEDISIPDIGDTIDIYDLNNASLLRAKFIALDLKKLMLENLDTQEQFSISSKLVFKQIYFRDKPFDIKDYKDFPQITIIKLEEKEGELFNYLVDEIEYVTVHYKYQAKYIGFAIGLAIDITIALVLLNNLDGGFGGGVSF